MQRGEYRWRERAFDERSALHRHLEVLADHRLRGSRAEGDENLGLHSRDLALQPLMACVDFALRGRLVQAPLAAQLPLEVLHGVRDVKMLAVDAGSFERPVEEPPRRADEGQAFLVL